MSAALEPTLAADIRAFLTFKRALGLRYARGEYALRAFARFVEAGRVDDRRSSLESLARAWITRSPQRNPRTILFDLSVLRQFGLFRARRDPAAFVPDREMVPIRKPCPFVPHVLTKQDVLRLLALADRLGNPPFRATMYRALILVLYCTGVRFGEAVRLRMRDVDLDNDVLFIAPTKGRSRWVPFHRSLSRALSLYARQRHAFAQDLPDDQFFLGHCDRRLTVQSASYGMCALLRNAGLKPESGRPGPRPYDFRHAFAVQRITQWYQAGADVPARVPWLSAYMGHDNILGTEKYLSATPELMELAANRLRARLSTARTSR
jgi:integrase